MQRPTSVTVFGILNIVFAVFGFCGIAGTVGVFMMLGNQLNNPAMQQNAMMQKAHTEQGPEAAGAMGGAIGGMFGGCLGIIYPILLLIFMLRSNVTAAFRAQSSENFQPPVSPL